MIDEHDEEIVRCRRLGHEVPFRYCRQESEGRPCRLTFDCWWERFDVQSFLKDHLEPEAFEALQKREPPNKVLSLVEIIEQAKARVHSKKD